MDELAIIIVSYNTKDLTKQCLDSLFEAGIKIKYKVWVVDNCSSDGSAEMLRKYSGINLIETDDNLGFAGANNLVLEKLPARWSLLLNSDTIVSAGAIEWLVESASQNKFDVASCRLTYLDGKFQANGGDLPQPIPVFNWLLGVDDIARKFGIKVPTLHYVSEKEFMNGIGWVAGTAMLINIDVVNRIGVLDNKIFMYAEDVDFCWRATRAGFCVGWVKDASIIHIGGGSSKNPRYVQWRGEFKGLLYLYRKYYGVAASLLLRFFIWMCIMMRIVCFAILGRWSYVKAYGKVIVNY